MRFTLQVWRQSRPEDPGAFVDYAAQEICADSSFLEMLDVVNDQLIASGEEPIHFDHDCREGICGACGLMINGQPHGPIQGITTCQLHMRHFTDGQRIIIEPWRAAALPIIKDLMVDRTAFDRIIAAGGYVSVNTGGAPSANTLPVAKEAAERAMDAAACIDCGACVAACPNAAAQLFTAAKITHLAQLPQGQAERDERARAMVAQMEAEGFGYCTNHGECQAVCPKGVSMDNIAFLNHDFRKAWLEALSSR